MLGRVDGGVGKGAEPRISGTTIRGGWVAGWVVRAGRGDVPRAEASPTLGQLPAVGSLVLQREAVEAEPVNLG
jgi:hypothetical protein